MAACDRCAAELQVLPEGNREGHICNHRGEERKDGEGDRGSDAGSESSRRVPVKTRGKPRVGLLRDYISNVDTAIDGFSDAVAVLVSLLDDEGEKERYDDHMVVWVEHCENLKERARDTIDVLEAAAAISRDAPIQNNNFSAQVTSSVSAAVPTTMNEVIGTQATPLGHFAFPPGPSSGSLPTVPQPGSVNAVTTGQIASTDTTNTAGGPTMSHRIGSVSVPSNSGWIIGSDNMYSSTNLELAIQQMNSIGNSINEDLNVAEQEVMRVESCLTDASAADMVQLCKYIEEKVEVKYREAGGKVVRMDIGRKCDAMRIMEENIATYQGCLRQIQMDIRRARASGTPSTHGSNDTPVHTSNGSSCTPVPTSNAGFKPYMERLKPPTFSGKVEDWPEFRSVWKDLLSSYPDSIQVQHVKANLPAADARLIAGVNNMAEVWKRLEKVYGDTKLNILTVKQNLEGFLPKATDNCKRVLEVFEAVEMAVTQLTNLNALRYIKEDFGLMAKIVAKLPIDDQKRYDEYVTSDTVSADPSSDWDKFWTWLEKIHKSAVQGNLRSLCTRTNTSGSASIIRSGITCNSCGGLGHFARACPSKSKLSGGTASIKVNIAVAKISTKEEYRKHLPETRKQLGNCPSCNQPAHNYSRKFPFGQGDWPSSRLDSCPQFVAKTPRERGELVERIKACYKCTNWKHEGDACYTKNKSNYTAVTAGTACAGVHHKLLHGSGVAFCHKVHVQVASTVYQTDSTCSEADDPSLLPDINQPVLLEIQSISVHGVHTKVMFDKGSTAALMTHSFAEKAGLKGEKVSYWLVVVGHDSILRQTLLYKFCMIDNDGIKHEMQAFGIEQISEESKAVDLNGVMTVFPGAPKQVFDRPVGPIDILIGSMYMDVQPYGGEENFTKGRLRLMKSKFGCGYILTGTHPSISVKENAITYNAETLVNCAFIGKNVAPIDVKPPTVLCNRAVTAVKLPEFFESEELGVTPGRSCKRCRNCKDCSYRGLMISREQELVVRRVEDLIKYDSENCKVSVGYPWTENVVKLTDNLKQATDFQSSVERRLLRDGVLDSYNSELRKFIERGAITKITQEELDTYKGPTSYVTHHGVLKPNSVTTPLRIVTNTSLKNRNSGLSPNECMAEGPNALSSLLEVLIGFRMCEVALVYDMTKAYQSISTGETERHVRRIVWRWGDVKSNWEIYGYNVVTFGDQVAGLILELVKKLAADMGMEIDPEASDQIRHMTYVDDGAGGGSRSQVERFRGKLINGEYDGTLARILRLVNLRLKVMVASGDTDPERLALLGEKVLGHTWRPTEDEFVFTIKVNLSTKKRGQKSGQDLVEVDIPRLLQIKLTKRVLLGFVMSQYDPMGIICPLTIIMKIELRNLFGPDTELGWDNTIPDGSREVWVKMLTMFLRMGEIIVKRSVRPEGVADVPEIIACAIYVRWQFLNTSNEDHDRFAVSLV